MSIAFHFDPCIPAGTRVCVQTVFNTRKAIPAWLKHLHVFVFSGDLATQPEATIQPRPDYQTAHLRINPNLFDHIECLAETLDHEIDHLFQGNTLRMVQKLADEMEDEKGRTFWEAFSFAIELDRNELERVLRPVAPLTKKRIRK